MAHWTHATWRFEMRPYSGRVVRRTQAGHSESPQALQCDLFAKAMNALQRPHVHAFFQVAVGLVVTVGTSRKVCSEAGRRSLRRIGVCPPTVLCRSSDSGSIVSYTTLDETAWGAGLPLQ